MGLFKTKDGRDDYKYFAFSGEGTENNPFILDAVASEQISAEVTSTKRTPDFLVATDAGVLSDCTSIAIVNIGDNSGVLLGKPFPAGASVSWSASGNDILSNVAYDGTGTSLLIVVLR